MNKSNLLFLSGIIGISIFIILFMVYLSGNCTFWGDDSYFSQYEYNEKLFSSLNFNFIHGGGYIGLFLCKFFSFKLPLILGIHPNDFLYSYCGYIRGFFNVIIFLLISCFATIHKKSKLLYLLIFLFVTVYAYISGINSNVIYINYNWWRYFFSLLFVSIFLYYLYTSLINNQSKTNWKQLIIASISAFIVGTSIEISFFSCALFISLIFLSKKFLKLNPDISFYMMSGFLLTAIFLFTNNSKFEAVAAERGLAQLNLSFDVIKEFTLQYFQVCIIDEWFYWLTFTAILVINFIIARKKQELNQIILPLLFEFSIMAVMFSLVLCGKTFDEFTRDRFYLSHLNIIFLFKMLILFPLFIYISYLYKNIQTNIKLKYLLLSIIFITTLIKGIQAYNFKYYITNNYQFEVYKECAYILHKISRFYYLQNKTAELPSSIINKYYGTYINENYHNYIISNSMALTYKNPDILKLRYIITDDAIEKYYENGGKFTKYELENINFSRLYDDNYILDNEYSVEDINKRIKNIKI